MKEKFKLTEVWVKIALLFVFSGFYLAASPYPAKSREFPQLLAILSLIMTLISLGMDFSRKETAAGEITDVDDTELKILDAETKRARKKRLYQAWAIIIVSTAAGFLGGFLFSTLLYFLFFAVFFGKKEKLLKNIAIAVAMTILIYVTFQRIMGVPLLEGIFS